MAVRLAAILMLVATSGCGRSGTTLDTDAAPTADCDYQLNIVLVTVTTADGAPIDGLATTSTFDGGGEVPRSRPSGFGPGTYEIAEDGDLPVNGSERVTFVASSPTSSVEGHYKIAADDCGHILADGPTTLVLP